MASSVFFKFKSQKEPTRVYFDGTGISVFELKRDIISKSGLGDGTDFDLHIYTDDNSEEYDDDTVIVPRSTTVIARRQPAMKPGAGRAARYVSGKMPASAKSSGRKDHSTKATAPKPSSEAINQMSKALTEEEKMAAMFAAQDEQWSAQQEELSHQAPVYKCGAKRPANVPDHEPPSGYICYRCGNKGHWIQLCPTNDDPEFDNRPRVKRTTGIPRSFLQKVDKSAILAQTDGDDSKRPSGIMMNADGDFVIAEPDKVSWEQFQAKAKSSAANQEATADNKELMERGLECSIDKKMFVEPMKTPCCKRTFCNDCITNALIESDFVCPACHSDGVLLDDLTTDEDMAKRVQDYLKEKEEAKTPPAPPSTSPKGDGEGDLSEVKADGDAEPKSYPGDSVKEEAKLKSVTKSPSPEPASKSSPPSSTNEEKASKSPPPKQESDMSPDNGREDAQEAKPLTVSSKKRSAGDDFLENPRIPKGPKAMREQEMMEQTANRMGGMPNMGMNDMFNGMGMMPNLMGMPTMNMNMNMGMPMMGMSMMGMSGFGGMNGAFGAGMGDGWGMSGMNDMAGMASMNASMMGMMGMGGGGMPGAMNGAGQFAAAGGANDGAYFRTPINPHRHQNKPRRARPSDYREL